MVTSPVAVVALKTASSGITRIFTEADPSAVSENAECPNMSFPYACDSDQLILPET